MTGKMSVLNLKNSSRPVYCDVNEIVFGQTLLIVIVQCTADILIKLFSGVRVI